MRAVIRIPSNCANDWDFVRGRDGPATGATPSRAACDVICAEVDLLVDWPGRSLSQVRSARPAFCVGDADGGTDEQNRRGKANEANELERERRTERGGGKGRGEGKDVGGGVRGGST